MNTICTEQLKMQELNGILYKQGTQYRKLNWDNFFIVWELTWEELLIFSGVLNA